MDWRVYASRVIVALDPPSGVEPIEWASRVWGSVAGFTAGFKVGWPLVLRAGAGRVSGFACKSGGLRLLDLKLADVAHVMKLVLEELVDCFDAVIAHAFIGGEGALIELRDYLEEHGAKLVLVYSMSHPGARETFDACRSVLDAVVRSVSPWGLVVPATRVEVVREVRVKHGDLVLFSPGVGAQGGEPGAAICAGADYEIVGRSIAWSDDPLSSLRSLAERGARRLAECRVDG